jgi:hypothetical protein
MNRRLFVQALTLPCLAAGAEDAGHRLGVDDPKRIDVREV